MPKIGKKRGAIRQKREKSGKRGKLWKKRQNLRRVFYVLWPSWQIGLATSLHGTSGIGWGCRGSLKFLTWLKYCRHITLSACTFHTRSGVLYGSLITSWSLVSISWWLCKWLMTPSTVVNFARIFQYSLVCLNILVLLLATHLELLGSAWRSSSFWVSVMICYILMKATGTFDVTMMLT